MSYNKSDITKLFNHFYDYVNNIIYDIHINNFISKNLFYCKYLTLNNEEIIKLPLTICLGLLVLMLIIHLRYH
jgi:hypothetical protein